MRAAQRGHRACPATWADGQLRGWGSCDGQGSPLGCLQAAAWGFPPARQARAAAWLCRALAGSCRAAHRAAPAVPAAPRTQPSGTGDCHHCWRTQSAGGTLPLWVRCPAKTCCSVRVLAIQAHQARCGSMSMQCLSSYRQPLELPDQLYRSEMSWLRHAKRLSVHLLHCHVLDVHLEPSRAVPTGQPVS